MRHPGRSNLPNNNFDGRWYNEAGKRINPSTGEILPEDFVHPLSSAYAKTQGDNLLTIRGIWGIKAGLDPGPGSFTGPDGIRYVWDKSKSKYVKQETLTRQVIGRFLFSQMQRIDGPDSTI